VTVPNASSVETFRQSFREEAREIVVELEATLLELHQNPSDPELVGKAFRGLHTIKGSGSMFGFDMLAAFTHELENAFDSVRTGKLEITPELVDLTLAALDQIRLMIEDGEGRERSEPAKRERVLNRVRALCGEERIREEPKREEKQRAVDRGNSNSPGAAVKRTWRIRFAPGPELMRDGTNPLLLLKELGQLGTAQIKADLSALPPLNEIDPERCYIRWDVKLTTESDADAIRDIFIFVEDSCELTISPVAQEAPDAAKAQQTGLEEQRSGSPGRRP
jgi:two-component system chemotaxis sensor kinase CheA